MNRKELLEAFCKAYDGVGVPREKRTDLENPEYVGCIYDLVEARKPQRILELGVEYGFSTVAMLLACQEYGGRVWSVDVEIRREAVEAVGNLGLLDRWSWFKMDDLKYADMWRTVNAPKFDFIYVDTEHIYEHCRKEIESFHPHLALGGIMAFHDVSAGQGTEVFKAIKEFMQQHPEYRFTGYKQDIGIIYTQEKVLLEMDSCGCGSKVYELGKFHGDSMSYQCVKCGHVLTLPFGYKSTREVGR